MSPGRIEEDTIISQPMMQKFGLLFLNSGSCKHVQSYAEAAEVVVMQARLYGPASRNTLECTERVSRRAHFIFDASIRNVLGSHWHFSS